MEKEKPTKVLRVTPSIHKLVIELQAYRKRGENKNQLITNLILEEYDRLTKNMEGKK